MRPRRLAALLALLTIGLGGWIEGDLRGTIRGHLKGNLGAWADALNLACSETTWYVDSSKPQPVTDGGCFPSTAYPSLEDLVAARGVDGVGDGLFDTGDVVRTMGSWDNAFLNGQGGGWPNGVVLDGQNSSTFTAAVQITDTNGIWTFVADRAEQLTIQNFDITQVPGSRNVAVFYDGDELQVLNVTVTGEVGNGTGSGSTAETQARLFWIRDESSLDAVDIVVDGLVFDVQIMSQGVNNQYYDGLVIEDAIGNLGTLERPIVTNSYFSDWGGTDVFHSALAYPGVDGVAIHSNTFEVDGRGVVGNSRADGVATGPEYALIQNNVFVRRSTAQAQCMADEGFRGLWRRNVCYTTAPPDSTVAQKSGLRAQQSSGSPQNQMFEFCFAHNTTYRLEDEPDFSPLPVRIHNSDTSDPLLNAATMQVDVRNNALVEVFPNAANLIGVWSSASVIPSMLIGNVLLVEGGTPGLCRGDCGSNTGRDDGTISQMEGTGAWGTWEFNLDGDTGAQLFADPSHPDPRIGFAPASAESRLVDAGQPILTFVGSPPCVGAVCQVSSTRCFLPLLFAQSYGGDETLVVDTIDSLTQMTFTAPPFPAPVDGEGLGYRAFDGTPFTNLPDAGWVESTFTYIPPPTSACIHDQSLHDNCDQQ